MLFCVKDWSNCLSSLHFLRSKNVIASAESLTDLERSEGGWNAHMSSFILGQL